MIVRVQNYCSFRVFNIMTSLAFCEHVVLPGMMGVWEGGGVWRRVQGFLIDDMQVREHGAPIKRHGKILKN